MSPATLPDGLPVPADGLLPPSILEPVALRTVYPKASADAEVASGIAERTFSLYIHVPFCVTRCGYCDFNTYTAQELGPGVSRKGYARTAAREIDFAAAVLEKSGAPRRPVHSIFFGGGTPTILPCEDLAFLVDKTQRIFGIEPDAEITVEANPDTVTEEKIQVLASAGFTRISLGMQSVVPRILGILERSHSPKNVAQAVQWAKSAGLSTSVDLIYGTPTETMEEWQESLEAALSYGVDHMSAYSLIVEPGTKLAARIRRQEIPPADDDEHAEKYLAAERALSDAGFLWYEISNWSRGKDLGGREENSGECAHQQRQSQHNVAYWRSGDWWGIGPGAHSHIGGVRWWNVKHPAAYARQLDKNISPAASREILDAKTRLAERLMLETRLREGLPFDLIPEGKRRYINNYLDQNLIDGINALRGRLVLTVGGRLLADQITRQLWD